MKLSIALFSILICGALLLGCSSMSDYPRVRDVPTDVKPTLTFEDAKKELAEMAQERDSEKAKP